MTTLILKLAMKLSHWVNQRTKQYYNFGKIWKYQKVYFETPNPYSTTFPFYFSAHQPRGSSGGALLNLDFKLIGINFEVHKDGDSYCVDVPIEKVWEFLRQHVYKS